MKKPTKTRAPLMFLLLGILLTIVALLSSCPDWCLVQDSRVTNTYYINKKHEYKDIEGLENPWGIAVSPDNANVYVAGSKNVGAFTADSAGDLTLLEKKPIAQGARASNNDSLVGAGVGARSIVVSKDGKQVYVSVYEDNTIKVFTRDTSTGKLSLVETLIHGSIDSAGNSIEGLEGAIDILASSDNNHVYVLGYKSDAIVTFARNKDTNELKYKGQLQNSSKESGLDEPREMAFGANETRLYVVGYKSNSLVRLTRDASTGVLTINKVYTDTDDFKNAISMDGPIDVIVEGMYSDGTEDVYISTGTTVWEFRVSNSAEVELFRVFNKNKSYYKDTTHTWKSESASNYIATDRIHNYDAYSVQSGINYQEDMFFYGDISTSISSPREMQSIGYHNKYITSTITNAVVHYDTTFDHDIEWGCYED